MSGMCGLTERGSDPAVGAPRGHQTSGVGGGGGEALTSPSPRDAALTPRLVRPRPGPMTAMGLALGRPEGRGPPRRLRRPAPRVPPHRLGRVATAAAAAATSSRHSPASRTLRARRGRGPRRTPIACVLANHLWRQLRLVDMKRTGSS